MDRKHNIFQTNPSKEGDPCQTGARLGKQGSGANQLARFFIEKN
jgi:hypothetical protein